MWACILLLNGLILNPFFGVDLTQIGNLELFGAPFNIPQFIIVALIIVTQALFNHFGIRVTTLLTDFSGYLIFATAIVLTIALLAFAPSLDFSRLFTFTNFTGDPGAGVWPRTDSMFTAFLLGLLLVCYTITGFDASAHTSEETRDAARIVPRGMLQAVFWSGLFGYIMVCSFVLAMPSVEEGAAQGWNVFYWLLRGFGACPDSCASCSSIGIVVSNYLCALAGLTSLSRMTYRVRARRWPAVLERAQDRQPGLSHAGRGDLGWRGAHDDRDAVRARVRGAGGRLRGVPVSFLCHADRRRAAGRGQDLDAQGAVQSWRVLQGSWRCWRFWARSSWPGLGMQPPNEKVLYVGVGLAVVMAVFWFAFERKPLRGPADRRADRRSARPRSPRSRPSWRVTPGGRQSAEA